ncbi:MAG: hypothetical protein P8Y14_14360 [Anaerolineales bacterium]
MKYARKRAGSLSPSSSESQAMAVNGTALLNTWTHSLTRVVLPKPAGAEIRISLHPG